MVEDGHDSTSLTEIGNTPRTESVAPPAGNAVGTTAFVPDAGSSSRGHSTRIHPSRDIVKLKDRLHYILQPPLETLIRNERIVFPFNPFPFQLQGVAFLYPRMAGILADEMGLGKTMQTITAVRLLLRARKIRSVLLICPKPLVMNWQREFFRWAPELPIAVIEGDQSSRQWQWRQTNNPIKVANYELMVRDRDVVADPLLQFDLVVLDEAQRIKNRSSHTSRVVRSIARRRSWALTGTPIENSSDDLLGIFEFVAPGTLRAGMKPRHMAQAARDYILRRTKDEVLTELPPKWFRDAEVDLLAAQRETYRMAEEEGVLRLTGMGDGVNVQHVFELILRLKQICNFDPATGGSAKFERLIVDLEELAANGHKALVFSQWVQTLLEIRNRLPSFNPLEFHGQVPQRKRDEVLRRFEHDPACPILLTSYGAGGVGLNLQFASYVFLFDRWWNPAVEDQAINRAHRLGSKRPVTITRLVAVNTIEERIEQILAQKRELADAIFSIAGQPSQGGLSQQELFSLFDLRMPGEDKP